MKRTDGFINRIGGPGGQPPRSAPTPVPKPKGK